MKFWRLASTTAVLALSMNVNAAPVYDYTINDMTAEGVSVLVNFTFDHNAGDFTWSNQGEVIEAPIGSFGGMSFSGETRISDINIGRFWVDMYFTDRSHTYNWFSFIVDEYGPDEGEVGIIKYQYRDYDAGQWVSGDTRDFYFRRTEVDTASVVPVPAALWLFGSGLLGLVGFARNKKA